MKRDPIASSANTIIYVEWDIKTQILRNVSACSVARSSYCQKQHIVQWCYCILSEQGFSRVRYPNLKKDYNMTMLVRLAELQCCAQYNPDLNKTRLEQTRSRQTDREGGRATMWSRSWTTLALKTPYYCCITLCTGSTADWH